MLDFIFNRFKHKIPREEWNWEKVDQDKISKQYIRKVFISDNGKITDEYFEQSDGPKIII